MSKKNDCFYEAGPAVILWLFGKSFDIVKIDMQLKACNRTKVRDYVCDAAHMISKTKIEDRLTEQYMTQQAKFSVMYFLSRLAIRGRIDGVSDWFDQDGDVGQDYDHASKIVKSLYGDTKKSEQTLARWARWCDEAFDDAKVWMCVEAVAEHLQKSKKPVTGPQIKKLLHNVWSIIGPPYRAIGRKWRERLDI